MNKFVTSLAMATLLTLSGPALSQTSTDAPVATQDGARDASDDGFDMGWLGLLGLLGLAGLRGRNRHTDTSARVNTVR